MEAVEHEIYEDARRRVRQKKTLFFHLVIFVLGSIFMYIANEYYAVDPTVKWYLWATTIWAFLFILHAIKVLVVDSFMNKRWEREQINKLMDKQRKKLAQLEVQVAKDFPSTAAPRQDNSTIL